MVRKQSKMLAVLLLFANAVCGVVQAGQWPQIPVLAGADDQESADIHGTMVVWQEFVSEFGDYDIYAADINDLDNVWFTVLGGASDQMNPAVYGHRVVWQDLIVSEEAVDWDIRMADITDLERFREEHREDDERPGVKLTLLPLLMKAVVKALQEYPQMGASLDRSGESLIVKKYYHLGIAVDTPDGLVVPVIRDVDRKSPFELAEDLAHMSKRARSRRLRPEHLQGGCFTISSLGGIGGTGFTPVVNAPEVAILGVSRSVWKPVWADGEFVARLILPLSLSYDHRVIDGAAAVRFTTHLCELLADVHSLVS